MYGENSCKLDNVTHLLRCSGSALEQSIQMASFLNLRSSQQSAVNTVHPTTIVSLYITYSFAWLDNDDAIRCNHEESIAGLASLLALSHHVCQYTGLSDALCCQIGRYAGFIGASKTEEDYRSST